MDKEGLPPGSALRARAMKGGDAASLLGRMPERYSHVVRQWAERDPFAARSEGRRKPDDVWRPLGCDE